MKRLVISVSKDVAIRSWRPEDSAELFRLTGENRKILQEWLAWVPLVKKEKDSLNFIRKCLKEYKEKSGLELGIWFKDRLIGCIGLHHINKENRGTSIGYWLSLKYQGKGIMVQTVHALVNYGFRELNLNRIDLKAGKSNIKSRAIPEKLGFKLEGILREEVFVNNRFVSHAVYSILQREWKN